LQKFDHNIGFWEKCKFFPEIWQKLQKIVIVTSTPAFTSLFFKLLIPIFFLMWVQFFGLCTNSSPFIIKFLVFRIAHFTCVELSFQPLFRMLRSVPTIQVPQPGVDVMITIFCDFYQFSAKQVAFFSKTNVIITIFAKTSFVLSQKRQDFR
jgi:hypothetical protein